MAKLSVSTIIFFAGAMMMRIGLLLNFLRHRHDVFQNQRPHAVQVAAQAGLFQSRSDTGNQSGLRFRHLRQRRHALAGRDGLYIGHMR